MDTATRLVWDTYNSGKQGIEIDSFFHLFTIEKLTQNAYSTFIRNNFDISFVSMVLDFHKETNRKPISLTRESIKKVSFGCYWFIAFSENFNLIKENDRIITVSKNDKEFEFSLDDLERSRITVQDLGTLDF